MDAKGSQNWCHINFINHRSMRRAKDIITQLTEYLVKLKLPIKSCKSHTSALRKSIISGYFHNAARRTKEGYVAISPSNTVMHIHPSSTYFNSAKAPQWTIYHELVYTSKEYIRDIVKVNPKWLVEMAPSYFCLVNINVK
eukprot:NODE_9445_length_591_cov_27.651709_g8810_i0.p1 GENE.NODE_9445_length_591_cov_27.651709_g8810_i0~~NODE_9445_length_591_cov_27.651709_g8810_i0.p1  ORF type:complete len:140 (+),score=15.70 NODE_9445_length_591_cov_27.651709_g8810_i0:149-568(+)